MYQAAEQQLVVVAAQAERLELSVQRQMTALKDLRADRQAAHTALERARIEFAAAEERAARLDQQHDEAEASLRETAADFARTQLLQRKYENTLAELQGFNRAAFRLSSTCSSVHGHERERGVATTSMAAGACPVALADDCTVVAVDRRRSFTVDLAYQSGQLSDSELCEALGIPNMASDVLSGTNLVVFSFGPSGSGKTEVLHGARHSRGAAGVVRDSAVGHTTTQGVLSLFAASLFGLLETLEVTHFSIRCSVAELVQDQVLDLVEQQQWQCGPVVSLGAASSGVYGNSFAALAAVQVQSASDLLDVLDAALVRAGRWRKRQSTLKSADSALFREPSCSHTICTLVVENFNTRGHYRRATAVFADLCGQYEGGIATPQQSWANASISALCDALTAASAGCSAGQALSRSRASQLHPSVTTAELLNGSRSRSHVSWPPRRSGESQIDLPLFEDLPHNDHKLVQALRDALGGNAKAVMLCCSDARASSAEELLNVLSYAHYFKRIRNNAVPYDIPPELQRLNLQMNTIFTEEDHYDGDRDAQRVGGQVPPSETAVRNSHDSPVHNSDQYL